MGAYHTSSRGPGHSSCTDTSVSPQWCRLRPSDTHGVVVRRVSPSPPSSTALVGPGYRYTSPVVSTPTPTFTVGGTFPVGGETRPQDDVSPGRQEYLQCSVRSFYRKTGQGIERGRRRSCISRRRSGVPETDLAGKSSEDRVGKSSKSGDMFPGK